MTAVLALRLRCSKAGVVIKHGNICRHGKENLVVLVFQAINKLQKTTIGPMWAGK